MARLKSIRIAGASLLTVVSAPLLAQAFGVTGGKMPSDYDATFDHRDGPYDWHVVRPPQPDPEFERYETNSIKGLGICRISALTRLYGVNETASLLAASNRIHKKLNAAFGASASIDLKRNPVPDFWTGKADPPASDARDPGGFVTFWMGKTGATMPSGLDGVVLIVMPEEDRPERRITVIYSFPNNDKCVETYKAAKRG